MGREQRDDAELVRAVAEGDRDALEELYRRHAPWLLLRMGQRCADRGIVEEALQDAFVTVWRTADRYRGDGEPAAWLWGIAVRTLMNRMRPRANVVARLVARRSGVSLDSAEELVLLGIEHGALGPAIDRLSPELRAVVQATVLDGLTTNEAARLLGIPSGTVKSRMSRARHELREALA